MSFTAKYSSLLARVYRWLWLGRVDSATPDIPAGSLIFAAHYNGAIDGFTWWISSASLVGGWSLWMR